AYPFEAKVGQFAGELSARFSAGSAPRSFLLTLDPRGDVVSLIFDDGSVAWRERRRELDSLGTPHLFYDPLDDGMEYLWLSWHGIEQAVMERLVGQPFVASDFQPDPLFGGRAKGRPAVEGWPASWGVMF